MGSEKKLEILSENLKKLNSESPARTRIEKLFDEGSFVELDAFAKTSGKGSEVITGYGLIAGAGAYVFSQDIEVNSGAVDMIHARKIKKVYELASMTGLPVVGIYDSNGARLDDMPAALNAYGEMILGSNQISGVVPQISLVLGTCAGAAAVAACGADVVIMSEGAELFLNSPRVAENGENVPRAGSADFAAKSGVAHLKGSTEDEAITMARHVICSLPQNNLSQVLEADYKDPAAAALKQLAAQCESMEGTRFSSILPGIVDKDSFFEISRDYGTNVTAGFATVCGSTVFVIAADEVLGNDECNKVAYYVGLCDSFSIPVVSFLNTDGFSPRAEDELSGLIRNSARVAHVYAQSTTQKISVITGRAYGSAYIALAGKGSGADLVFAWPSAVISPLYPTTAVAFMAGDRITSEKNRQQVEEEYKITDASPFLYAEQGYIDRVIHPAETREAIVNALDILAGKRVNTMAKKHSIMPL